MTYLGWPNSWKEKVEGWLPGSVGKGEMGSCFLMDIEFQLFPGEKVLEIGCPTMLIYSTLLKCILVVQMVKMVNFMLCIFYTSKKEKRRGKKRIILEAHLMQKALLNIFGMT